MYRKTRWQPVFFIFLIPKSNTCWMNLCENTENTFRIFEQFD